MDAYFWPLAICGVVIIWLIFGVQQKNAEIERQRKEYLSQVDKFKHEISQLKNDIANKNLDFHKYEVYTADLRKEIQRQNTKKENEYFRLEQKYHKLMRAYMVARKKNEVDLIKEIEDSISVDYETLGSTPMLFCGYIASAMADFYTISIEESRRQLAWMRQMVRSQKIDEVRKTAHSAVQRAKMRQYQIELLLQHIVHDYCEIDVEEIAHRCGLPQTEADLITHYEAASREVGSYPKEEVNNLHQRIRELEDKNNLLSKKVQECEEFRDIRWSFLRNSVEAYQHEFSSNLTAIPYMSKMIADLMTSDIDMLAWSLSWGNNQERKKKVASLNALKKETRDKIEELKWAEYQLAYLLEVYPSLQDVIDTEFKELKISFDELSDYDPASKYLSREEWMTLSETERNQLALDRYISSRKKSNWQIGRDYELYCGYRYEQRGYSVDYHGSYKGLEDLGRDLIVHKDGEIRIIQCKYWSQTKQIHENHIMQLYGSVVEYNLEHGMAAQGILLTNTVLSEKAKQFAKHLGIMYKENMCMEDFPRIKCNVNRNEFGDKTYIYHLPMDLNYDKTKIEKEDEFMAFTVAEAEAAGFRRAYKWHGTGN